jgi:hypothetical protein
MTKTSLILIFLLWGDCCNIFFWVAFWQNFTKVKNPAYEVSILVLGRGCKK